MKIKAHELFDKLVNEYDLIGQEGRIDFILKGLKVSVKTKDSVGNLFQEWLKEWFNSNNIEYNQNPNSQVFPDFYLNPDNTQIDLLEIKMFDKFRGPGFDIANFDSYCNSLITQSYRLDSDYLIFSYSMVNSIIKIENIWLKKIWEISGPSGPYPIKLQVKKDVIYNIRPIIWYSDKSTFKAFGSKEKFLIALNNTRYQYPPTRAGNGTWLNRVANNYLHYTGTRLDIPDLR